MKRGLVVVVGVTVFVFSTVLQAQSQAKLADLLVGMWKQSMEKSTYTPGTAAAERFRLSAAVCRW